ncbi:MAG: hypothetical protein ACO3DT_12255, partial [Gammaproteobacteria bacterium]
MLGGFRRGTERQDGVDEPGILCTPLKRLAAGHRPAGYQRHAPDAERPDFRDGDPSWRDGRGRNLIGALNYLASKGMNAVYFLTMNVAGDGDDVWPWIDATTFDRFDCSKLDQWEIVFSHMDVLGIHRNVVM